MSSLRPANVCDTTPLQRFESQSSSGEEPSSPTAASIIAAAAAAAATAESIAFIPPLANVTTTTATTAAAATTTAQATALPCLNNKNTLNAATTATPTTTTTTTATSTPTTPTTLTCIQQNNNNNHKIELNLPHFISNDANSSNQKMKSNGVLRILARLLLDLTLLCCVGLPIIGLSVWGEPNPRGFFCNDESLKHPYKTSTIRSWMLYLICVALPIALIIIVEFYRAHDQKHQNYTNYISSTDYAFCHLSLPDWLIESYKKVGILIFGCCVQQLTTDIAKYAIGRLRPHFFAVCQPIMFDGTTCNDGVNAHRYIENYSCFGGDVTAKMLKDVNLSFPSGHASFTFFTMVYTAIYLQKRMHWARAKMLKHLLQFMFVMFAWYTILTRVSDYKHHWTDVLAGSGIGITYAFIATSTLW